MNLNINKYIFSLIFSGLIFILIPSTTYASEMPSLNKKPIKIIINEAIAANTCALSSSGVIVCIEKKFAI